MYPLATQDGYPKVKHNQPKFTTIKDSGIDMKEYEAKVRQYLADEFDFKTFDRLGFDPNLGSDDPKRINYQAKSELLGQVDIGKIRKPNFITIQVDGMWSCRVAVSGIIYVTKSIYHRKRDAENVASMRVLKALSQASQPSWLSGLTKRQMNMLKSIAADFRSDNSAERLNGNNGAATNTDDQSYYILWNNDLVAKPTSEAKIRPAFSPWTRDKPCTTCLVRRVTDVQRRTYLALRDSIMVDAYDECAEPKMPQDSHPYSHRPSAQLGPPDYEPPTPPLVGVEENPGPCMKCNCNQCICWARPWFMAQFMWLALLTVVATTPTAPPGLSVGYSDYGKMNCSFVVVGGASGQFDSGAMLTLNAGTYNMNLQYSVQATAAAGLTIKGVWYTGVAPVMPTASSIPQLFGFPDDTGTLLGARVYTTNDVIFEASENIPLTEITIASTAQVRLSFAAEYTTTFNAAGTVCAILVAPLSLTASVPNPLGVTLSNGTVTVLNQPVAYPITGTVSVLNDPLQINGTVTVTNQLPNPLPVTFTNQTVFVDNQPKSYPVTFANQTVFVLNQNSQTVNANVSIPNSLTVAVSNFPYDGRSFSPIMNARFETITTSFTNNVTTEYIGTIDSDTQYVLARFKSTALTVQMRAVARGTACEDTCNQNGHYCGTLLWETVAPSSTTGLYYAPASAITQPMDIYLQSCNGTTTLDPLYFGCTALLNCFKTTNMVSGVDLMLQRRLNKLAHMTEGNTTKREEKYDQKYEYKRPNDVAYDEALDRALDVKALDAVTRHLTKTAQLLNAKPNYVYKPKPQVDGVTSSSGAHTGRLHLPPVKHQTYSNKVYLARLSDLYISGQLLFRVRSNGEGGCCSSYP